MFPLRLISAILVFAFTATSILYSAPSSLRAIPSSLAPQSSFGQKPNRHNEKEELRNSARVLLGLTRDDATALDLRQLSNDPALGRFLEGVFFPANDSEKPRFWQLLRQSCTDKEETLRRQRMISVLMVREEALRNKKDGAYSASSMLKGLFSYEEDGPRDKKRRRNIEKVFEECGYDVQKIKSKIGNYSKSIYALQEFISSCRSIKDPLFNAIIDEMEAQYKTLPFPSVETLMQYAKANDHEKFTSLLEQCEALDKMLVSIGAILAFASFAKKDEFCKTTFDESQPAGYSQGWHFTYPKKGKVPTDSGRDTPFKVFTGSNMSGKSFHLQQDFFIQLVGQGFGWAPAKTANLRFQERLAFIDRADTDSFHNLSAFGKDAKNWLTAIERLTEEDHKATAVYLMADEGFSTTSPEDQSALLTASVRFRRKHNITMELATHNEDFIKRHLNDEDISFYHFKVVFEPGKEPRFERELLEGPDDSHAIEVARSLGLQEVVLKKAENRLAGKRKEGIQIRKRDVPRVTPYDERERARLKKEKGNFLDFFPYSDSVVFGKPDEDKRSFGRQKEARFGFRFQMKERGYSEEGGDTGRSSRVQQARKRLIHPQVGYKPLFTLLSRDPELSGYPGDPTGTLVGGGANYSDHVVLPRLKHMIVVTPVLEGRQVLERQRMFDELLRENPEELTQMARRFEAFISALEIAGEYAEGFNLYLLKGIKADMDNSIGFGRDDRPQIAELFLAFLDFNIRLTGTSEDALGVTKDIAKLREWIKLHKDNAGLDVAMAQEEDDAKLEEYRKRRDLLYDRYFKLLGREPHDSEFHEAGDRRWIISFDSKIGEEIKKLHDRIHKAIEGKIPPISAFDEEKHPFILSEFKKMEPLMQEYLKGYMSWEVPPHVYVLEFLPYLLSEKDIGEEFFTRLRSTDSVYLNQFANYLEEMWRTYLGDIRTGMDYMRKVKGLYCRIAEARAKVDEIERQAEELAPHEFLKSHTGLIREHLAFLEERYRRVCGEVESYQSKKERESDYGYRFAQKTKEECRRDIEKWRFVLGLAERGEGIGSQMIAFDKTEFTEAETVTAEKVFEDDIVEELRMHFENEKWMAEEERPKFSDKEAEVFLTELSKLTDIFRYAQIMKAKNHARSRFHEKREIVIKGARDPYSSVPEEKQVANDSGFSEEEPVELLSGTNMSGKTHNEKSDIWNLLQAHCTGYSSSDGVETPVLDKIVYLDRVTARLFATLSALGSEVELWKKWVKAIQGEGLIFAAVDEAWSTTSPKYQEALSHAVFEYGLEEGAFMAISHHNHRFIRGFLEAFGRHVRVYNFRTRLADDGSAIYDYVKQPGHEKSNAIMAAKKMGLTALTDEIEDLCPASSPTLRESLLAPQSSFSKEDKIENELKEAIATLDIERTRFALQSLERRVYENADNISDTIIEQLGIVAKSITSVRGCFGVDLQTLAVGILKDIALKARPKIARQAAHVLESIGHSPNIYGYAYINSLYALREVTEKRASLLRVRALIETDSDILLEVVDKKFNSLRLRGFMDGTRAYIKLLILQEAARKGVVSDHFMQGLREEIIPALHVLEEMAKSHPPLRVSARDGCLFENFDQTQRMFHRVVGIHYLGGNAVFMSYSSDIVASCSLVLPSTCYPILILLLDKMRELDLIDLGSYKTMVQGNYLKESAFLLSCFSFLNLSPDNEFFPLPIALGRFHGLIGSWIFESGCTSHFVWGGETAFFHAAIDQAMYRRAHGLPDLLVADWYDDIRRVAMLSAAASDKSLARMYGSLKKDVMRFLINQVELSKDDAENLFPSYDFFTYMHPDVGNELMKSLVRLASYLVIIIGDSEEEQFCKRKLHGEFQDIVNRHVDEIERHLFSILEIDILRFAREDKWNEVRRRLGNAAFSDSEISRSALHYLRVGRYSEYKAMRDVLRRQRKGSRNFARTCL